MTDTPPDRLSNDPGSRFYDEALLARGIGQVDEDRRVARIDCQCGLESVGRGLRLSGCQRCLPLRDQRRRARIGRCIVACNRNARRHGKAKRQGGGSGCETHQELLQC